MSNINDQNAETKIVDSERTLKSAMNSVKVRLADRDDVVVELKAAERTRLDLLAEELRPVMADIDETDERFDFALTSGERPRLWIDMTSFVSMGHDKRSYRFIKDTRMGRVVLAETHDLSKAADIVSEYVAERVLERERMVEGEWISLKETERQAAEKAASATAQKRSKWRSFFWFLLGCCAGVAALVATAFVLIPDAF